MCNMGGTEAVVQMGGTKAVVQTSVYNYTIKSMESVWDCNTKFKHPFTNMLILKNFGT